MQSTGGRVGAFRRGGGGSSSDDSDIVVEELSGPRRFPDIPLEISSDSDFDNLPAEGNLFQSRSNRILRGTPSVRGRNIVQVNPGEGTSRGPGELGNNYNPSN